MFWPNERGKINGIDPKSINQQTFDEDFLKNIFRQGMAWENGFEGIRRVFQLEHVCIFRCGNSFGAKALLLNQQNTRNYGNKIHHKRNGNHFAGIFICGWPQPPSSWLTKRSTIYKVVCSFAGRGQSFLKISGSEGVFLPKQFLYQWLCLSIWFKVMITDGKYTVEVLTKNARFKETPELKKHKPVALCARHNGAGQQTSAHYYQRWSGRFHHPRVW